MNINKRVKRLPKTHSTDSEKSTISSSISKVSWTGSESYESPDAGPTNSKRPRLSTESDSDCELIENPSLQTSGQSCGSGQSKRKQDLTLIGTHQTASHPATPQTLSNPFSVHSSVGLDHTSSKQLPNLITNYATPQNSFQKQNSPVARSLASSSSFTIAVSGPPPLSASLQQSFSAILSSNLGIQPPPFRTFPLPPPHPVHSPPNQSASKPGKNCSPSKSSSNLHPNSRLLAELHSEASNTLVFPNVAPPCALLPPPPPLRPLSSPIGLLPPPPPIPLPFSLITPPSHCVPSRHCDMLSLQQLLSSPELPGSHHQLPPILPVPDVESSLPRPAWHTRPTALFLANIGTRSNNLSIRESEMNT